MSKDKSTGKKLADMMYGNPEGAAFGIYPKAGKRSEDKQDREAAKNMPVDLARGLTAGFLGMPADILNFPGAIYSAVTDKDSYKIPYGSEDILKSLPLGSDTPTGQFASGLGTLIGGSAPVGPAVQGVKAGARGALSAARAGERMAERVVPQIMERGGAGADVLSGLTQGSRSNVIKPKGGNWLGGNLMGNIDENVRRLKPYTKAGAQPDFLQKELKSYEAALERLKNDKYALPQMVQAQQDVVDNIKKKIAINNWVESNLGKYVKNQMATPEDPIRLLLDKRTKEIEAKHAKDIERAERMAQRAMDEPDPRRQANMIRESERLKMEANVERQFAMDSIIPSRMQDYSPDADQYLKQRRQEAGFPAEGMGESEAAKRYETLTDDAIEFDRAGDLQAALVNQPAFYAVRDQLASHTNELKAAYKKRLQDSGLSPEEVDALDRKTPLTEKAYTIGDERYQQLMDEFKSLSGSYTGKDLDAAKQNPFVSKLDPETPLYTGNTADMGFDHVIDILKQDVMEGRIRPEQLNKVSVEDAVRRTMDFDQEAARKMAEAQIKNMEGFPVYKEYPEGYRWIELAPSKEPKVYTADNLPKGFKLTKDRDGYYQVENRRTGEAPITDSFSRDPEEAIAKFNQFLQAKKRDFDLEDALKYEGDTMGHCVGGYCPDVLEGRSRIYSLRDAKGEPHVTVEVEPNQHLDYNKWYGEQPTSYKALLNAKRSDPGYDPYQEPAYLAARNAMPPKIIQIKGKQNRAPKEDYLPYVQDFVKSGQWSDVGDLGNTGLRRRDTPEGVKYMSDAEYSDDLLRELGMPPEDGMARGGRVHFSDNPDVMQLELAAGGAVRMQVGGIPKRVIDAGAKAIKALKPEKEAAVPLTLPRVRPTTKDILEAAERVGKQQAGEFVKSPLTTKTSNLAGRSKKEVERLKNLEYKVTPIKDLPEVKPYEAKIGEVNIALPGDQTISDMLLESVDDIPIGTTSEGGALFGRGRLSDPEETRAFWASNIGPAELFQKKVTELAQLYDTDMVTAYHLAMGQMSNNFAQHLADANIRAIDYSKLNKDKMNAFDRVVSRGYVDPTTKERVTFENWPGIADPEGSLQAMKEDPKLRKWFNNRMKTEKVTKPLDLPNAKSIEWAMTEPELRNMEINLTGLSAGRMKPGAELIPDSAHQTYSHDIPGTALGRAPELSPFSISFPDATAFVRDKYRPQDFTGTIQKVFPHQVVDEAYLEDMYKYYTQLRKVRGFNEGGEVKNQNNEQHVQNPVHFTESPDVMRLALTKRN